MVDGAADISVDSGRRLQQALTGAVADLAGSDTEHGSRPNHMVGVGGRRDEPEFVETGVARAVHGGQQPGYLAVQRPRGRGA
ncbi:hypothetical protein [Mycobacterium sp. pW045]|uniref:hypothetical protein n=1 Tax=Mycobacterium sp. pW045 TaxID=3238984 RepID=UPI00351B189C